MAMDLRRRNKQHVMETMDGKTPAPRAHEFACAHGDLHVDGMDNIAEGRDKAARRLMGHNPAIGEKAVTDAERQARYRVARAADAPVIRTRRPADHRSRARRWQDAVAQLSELQAQYADWLEALPANQHDSALAEALQAICELDLSELESVRSPTRPRTRLTFQRRALKTSQRVAPSGSQTPGLTTGATQPAVHPRGPTGTPQRYAPPAARRARRYARVPPIGLRG